MNHCPGTLGPGSRFTGGKARVQETRFLCCLDIAMVMLPSAQKPAGTSLKVDPL